MRRKTDVTVLSLLPIGLILGVAVGALIGTLTHNMDFWIPTGSSFGMFIALIIGYNRARRNDDRSDGKKK